MNQELPRITRIMDLNDYLNRLNKYLDDGTYRAQFEYGTDELRMEMLETADLLFEVGDKMEEILTDLMIRQGIGTEVSSPEEAPPDSE